MSLSHPFIHHTTKYDGSIHYRFEASVVTTTPEAIAIYRGPNIPMVSYRGSLEADTHLLQLFFAHAYHNVVIAWKEDWTPLMHYVNIATPATWNNERLSAIDMDLDVILRAGSDQIIIDDEDEFETHIGKFHYPKKLITSCRRELNRIHSAMTERCGIFGTAIYSWRPGTPLPEEVLLPC